MSINRIDTRLDPQVMTLREAFLATVKSIENDGLPNATFSTIEVIKMMRNILDIQWKDEV